MSVQKKSVARVIEDETMTLLRIALPRLACSQAVWMFSSSLPPGRNGGVEARTSSWVREAATRVQ